MCLPRCETKMKLDFGIQSSAFFSDSNDMAALLQRFRKPGGFSQLLALIETCDPLKQKNLLHLIGNEDPGWAYLVKLKMLTCDRVLTWPVETLMEITTHLPDRVLAAAWSIAAPLPQGSQLQEKWLKSLPTMKSREIKSVIDSTSFSPSELQAAGIRIVQTVRELEEKDLLRFSQFDPALEIDQRVAA